MGWKSEAYKAEMARIEAGHAEQQRAAEAARARRERDVRDLRRGR